MVRKGRPLHAGDALGLTDALKAGGKPGDVPRFVSPDAPHPGGPRDERGHLRQGYSPTGDVPTFKAPSGRPAMTDYQPAEMTFGEQVVEALGEYVDAKLDYAEARRGPAAEYANPDPVDKAAQRLQAVLNKVSGE